MMMMMMTTTTPFDTFLMADLADVGAVESATTCTSRGIP